MTTSAQARLPGGAPSAPNHGTTTMLLHWGAAALLVAAFALGLTLEDWPRGPQRDTVMMVHYSLGTLVFGLVMIRLLRRLLLPQPPLEGSLAARLAAGAMHWALYAMMVALPLTGALDRWARGRRLAIFGDNVIPAPFPIGGGRVWGEAHEVIANLLLALVALHVAAALWHHLVLRDGTLRRMLPALRA
ncbi:cytochrome b [Roseomonas eburnea]|uniref:Cytochrome b n=1 Tax=Neoroseomonas eburnea TaxID=1346889 RepID=A0A9X9X7X0_9PROT|nr:cytochrome b/b6 domain-containing protein [Neoroseomonas eburnea]MBR0679806.1 cytochrome b [Neoroseomonas eburnea]